MIKYVNNFFFFDLFLGTHILLNQKEIECKGPQGSVSPIIHTALLLHTDTYACNSNFSNEDMPYVNDQARKSEGNHRYSFTGRVIDPG